MIQQRAKREVEERLNLMAQCSASSGLDLPEQPVADMLDLVGDPPGVNVVGTGAGVSQILLVN